MPDEGKLVAKMNWNGNEAEFSGDITSVWQSLNRFIQEMNPHLHDISQIVLKFDLENLLRELSGLVFIDKDVGPVVDTEAKLQNLSDTERVVFSLLLKKISMIMGFSDDDKLTRKEVEKESGSKSAGVLLSQLSGDKIVQNVADIGKAGQYRITDYGVTWFLKKSISKLSEKE